MHPNPRAFTSPVERVPPVVWQYEVSGKQVLRQWFSYRQKDRSRPIMGDRRLPSKLGEVQPDHWPAEYTTDLIDLLGVLGLLAELEPDQARLLDRVCSGPLLPISEFHAHNALAKPPPVPASPPPAGSENCSTAGECGCCAWNRLGPRLMTAPGPQSALDNRRAGLYTCLN